MHFGESISDVNHAHRLLFQTEDVSPNDAEWPTKLAIASRTSACIPGVFEPSFLPIGKSDADKSGLPDFEAIVWWGILAPAGTPAAIVSRLDREIKAVLAMPEIRKAFANQGVEPDYQDSAGFRAFIAREIASWKQVVEKANIKLQ